MSIVAIADSCFNEVPSVRLTKFSRFKISYLGNRVEMIANENVGARAGLNFLIQYDSFSL